MNILTTLKEFATSFISIFQREKTPHKYYNQLSPQEQLDRIANYTYVGWDGDDAEPIHPEIIERARKILTLLGKCSIKHQPKIIPLYHGSIQFEWNNINGYFLELVLLDDYLVEYLLGFEEKVDSWEEGIIDDVEILVPMIMFLNLLNAPDREQTTNLEDEKTGNTPN